MVVLRSLTLLYTTLQSGDDEGKKKGKENNVGCAYLSSLLILAVVYRFFLPFLPSYRQPTDLPQSTDFFTDLANFNFFYRSFCYFM